MLQTHLQQRACSTVGRSQRRWIATASRPTLGSAEHGRRAPLHQCRAQPGSQPNDMNALAGMFMAYAMQMQQQAQQQSQQGVVNYAAQLTVDHLTYHPPGAEAPLLDDISFSLPANQLGLVIGRSGSGKTTLLQILSGLAEQNTGRVYIHKGPLLRTFSSGSNGNGQASVATAAGSAPDQQPTTVEQRMQEVGLVFQFPERHFLGDTLMQELTFSWPKDMAYFSQRQQLAVKLQQVVESVGLQSIPFDSSPSTLSGGQQRRLALALQLVRQPAVLLLDEPLAGLDWKSRAEVVQLLAKLKQQCTLLVVSHDLREIEPLVDCAFRMQGGGKLEQVDWQAERSKVAWEAV